MVSAASNSVNHSVVHRYETPATLFRMVPNCRTSQRRLCRNTFSEKTRSENDNQESAEDGAPTGLVTESLVTGRGMQTLSGQPSKSGRCVDFRTTNSGTIKIFSGRTARFDPICSNNNSAARAPISRVF